jgi:anti-anti-sigma factor
MDQWTIETVSDKCHVRVAGDLTAATVPQLQPALKQALAGGVVEVIFDLAKTVMLDSSGIGLLIAAYTSLTRRHGRVRVEHVSAEILQMLQSMRLIDRLCVTGREET